MQKGPVYMGVGEEGDFSIALHGFLMITGNSLFAPPGPWSSDALLLQ